MLIFFLPEWTEIPSVKSLRNNAQFKCNQGLAGTMLSTHWAYSNNIILFSMKLINLLLECEFPYGVKFL